MPPTKTENSTIVKNPNRILDFRSSDDAWYTISSTLEKETLTVKYAGFSEEYDEEFYAGDFKSLKQLENFENKFRPSWIQFQDFECLRVTPGMIVSASYVYSKVDLKFYNAVVESIIHKAHTIEQVCTCLFVVSWTHGPMIGTKESVRIERMCRPTSGSARIDPALDSFLKMSREKLELASRNQLFCALEFGAVTKRQKNVQDIYLENDNCILEEQGGGVTNWQNNVQDIHLGEKPITTENHKEKDNCLFIMVQNFENDLAPLTIVNFIYEHVSIRSQAYVFPSLESETYTRGIIVVDSKEKLQKLSDFLRDPAQLIMSSSGRPWVLTEENVRGRTLGDFMSRSESLSSPSKHVDLGSRIKVIHRGTKEFEKGEQLRNLFLEFAEHLQRLHKRLALEWEKILHSPNTT